MYEPMRNNHLIHMFVGEKTQEINMGIQDVDVPDIMFDLLTESKMHKKKDDHVYEEIKGDGSVVNTHDDLETLCDDVISKDERLLMVCASNRKVCGLFTNGIQSIDDMTPHNDEDFDLFGPDVKHNVTEKLGIIYYLLKKMAVLIILKLLILFPIVGPSE